MYLKKGEASIPIVRYREDAVLHIDDAMVVEEPLEIFLDGKPYYLTMRMPGQEVQLALGYCYNEGVIDSRDDVLLIHYCGEEAGNRVEMTLNPKRRSVKGFTIKEKRLTTYSSCGICGKEMVEDMYLQLQRRENTIALSLPSIVKMITLVETSQQIFEETGGTHAAAIFNSECRLLVLAEDVGRHNAFDKAAGQLILEDKIEEAKVAVVSSRLSYEIVQKAARCGVEVLIGFSAATSLAVELANSVNLTLIGFARKEQGNIYSSPERVKF